jgi:hypothetical protein
MVGAERAELGKVDKGVGCSVTGCKSSAQRSISRTEIGGSGLSVGGEGRRVYLCHEHYKAWKKATKKSKALERSRW